MNGTDFLIISPFINDCPNCGNKLVGNGEGMLEVENNMVKRSCKCGFKFEYDVNNGTSKKKIMHAIGEALKQM
ncbi:DUF3797 domain-containing protein (plasmid) [Aneurinibacillus sp. Ricciae_BoGa-3]|uniref:DUF3797 domain-containing protein n=1 Tax=Aneurinibacillus sp. Ricciae_BoGa-3 TaxID=3022697 RepID=UPI002341A13C|nr:DUF3797 domain-containing protein [Aneurinibacillus sp. Ricciae_BoGa-3]WCK57529.1 DUF3797 domain-containing protein [Aneurinibacillus sp. Ricciae_BoGa-3]